MSLPLDIPDCVSSYVDALRAYNAACEAAIITKHQRNVALDFHYEKWAQFEKGQAPFSQLAEDYVNECTANHRDALRLIATCQTRLDARRFTYERAYGNL
jgi:hypothetical protein